MEDITETLRNIITDELHNFKEYVINNHDNPRFGYSRNTDEEIGLMERDSAEAFFAERILDRLQEELEDE